MQILLSPFCARRWVGSRATDSARDSSAAALCALAGAVSAAFPLPITLPAWFPMFGITRSCSNKRQNDGEIYEATTKQLGARTDMFQLSPAALEPCFAPAAAAPATASACRRRHSGLCCRQCALLQAALQ